MRVMVAAAIDIPVQEIAELCRKHGIAELALFGSVLRDDFDPDRSDVDVFVQFMPGRRVGFFELGEIEESLSELFGGRKVDLVTKPSISQYLRDRILNEAKVVYERSAR